MVDWIKEILSGFFVEGAQTLFDGLLDFVFKCIAFSIIQPTEPGQYVTKFPSYLGGVQLFAAGLLIVFVVLAVFRQISGVLYMGDKSLGTYAINITLAGAFIYVLPKIVTLVFIPINNSLIGWLAKIGFESGKISALLAAGYAAAMNPVIGVMFLILLLGLLAFAVAGAIRYIEVLIAILIAPIAAISLVNNGDGLQIWFRETISIVFTQTIHFLILQMLISIMVGIENITIMVLLSIGCVAVGLKGPQILRQFMYKTGTTSAAVSTAGSTSRIGMMSLMSRK